MSRFKLDCRLVLILALSLMNPVANAATADIAMPSNADRSVPIPVASHLYMQGAYFTNSGQVAFLPNAKVPQAESYAHFERKPVTHSAKDFVVTDYMQDWMKSKDVLVLKGQTR